MFEISSALMDWAQPFTVGDEFAVEFVLMVIAVSIDESTTPALWTAGRADGKDSFDEKIESSLINVER